MTVAPNRPQDGNLRPSAGGSGAEPNDRSRLASVPPTLFRLPNLGAKPPRNQPAVGGFTGDDISKSGLNFELEGTEAGPTARPSLQRPIDSATVAAPVITGASRGDVGARGEANGLVSVSPVSDEGDFSAKEGSPARAMSPSVGAIAGGQIAGGHAAFSGPDLTARPDSTPSTAGIPSPVPRAPDAEVVPAGNPLTTPDIGPATSRSQRSDVPAGRTWMESLGSHGVVIVLLLVVVAAALLTGGGEDDPSSTSLTTQSELLNFDELNVDLPLPAHDTSVHLAESTQPANSMESNASSSSDFASHAAVIAVSPQVEVPQVEVPAARPETQETKPPVEGAAQSTAMLEAPLPVQVPAPASGAAGGPSEGLASSGVQVNQFVSPNQDVPNVSGPAATLGVPSSGVEAKPAANRVEAKPSQSSLPSLEELAGLHEAAGTSSQLTGTQSTGMQSTGTQSTGTNSSGASPVRVLTNTPVGISDWSKYLPPLHSAVEPDTGISSTPYQVLQP